MLAAEGIGCRITGSSEGWRVLVPVAAVGAATVALDAFDRENRRAATAAEADARGGRWVGLGVAGVLLAAYAATGSRDAAGPRFLAGAADAGRILDGEIWRTVTALTLHADVSHLVGNAVAGALLVTALARVLGPGLALLAVVLAGALGNLANAALRGAPHSAVGASTAVLGAVGVLSGGAVVRTARDRRTPGRAWMPLAAGFALLAMLGAGERTDLGAHLLGFVAGVGLGAAALLAWPRPPGTAVQRVLAALSVLLVGVAWAAAVRGG